MRNESKRGNSNGVMHVTPIGGNVFEDLGFSKEVATEMQQKIAQEIEQRNEIKRVMVDGLKREIARRGLSAVEAAKLLAISRPRLSDITHFKVEKFSIDCVSDLMARMGQTVQVVITGSQDTSQGISKTHKAVISE